MNSKFGFLLLKDSVDDTCKIQVSLHANHIGGTQWDSLKNAQIPLESIVQVTGTLRERPLKDQKVFSDFYIETLFINFHSSILPKILWGNLKSKHRNSRF